MGVHEGNHDERPATYLAQYDLDSSDWCQNSGQSGTPTYQTTAQPLGATDTSDHNVSVAITGLTAGTNYCALLVASNNAGDALLVGEQLLESTDHGANWKIAGATPATNGVPGTRAKVFKSGSTALTGQK